MDKICVTYQHPLVVQQTRKMFASCQLPSHSFFLITHQSFLSSCDLSFQQQIRDHGSNGCMDEREKEKPSGKTKNCLFVPFELRTRESGGI